MAIIYKYKYTAYEGFPIATAISRRRSRNTYSLFMIYSLTLFFGIIGLIMGEWLSIFVILAAIASMYYLFHYYPVVTERKVKKAIAQQLKKLEEIKNSKVPYIKD